MDDVPLGVDGPEEHQARRPTTAADRATAGRVDRAGALRRVHLLEELSRQLSEASESPSGRGDNNERTSEKGRRKLMKARRNLIRQLSWTPYHAFARASARPACTDVVCLLPLALLWGAWRCRPRGTRRGASTDCKHTGEQP